LKPSVLEELARHGIQPAEGEDAATLRERLNDAYLEEIRQLRARQQSGEIPLQDYARHVEALRARFPLLGLPLHLWGE
jgi:hypothetical protein